MSVLTSPPAPVLLETNAKLHPVPWQRMAWVTWRQHSVALAGVGSVLAALAIYLWLTGLQMHHAFAAVAACHPLNSGACSQVANDFNSENVPHAVVAIIMMQTVPALLGAFVGAPVLARELDSGTFRFAWTQGIGRVRWTLGKLVPLAVTLTAAAGAVSILFSWYYQPFFVENFQTPFAPVLFGLRGVSFAAWTLAAFALGALAGILIRRVVPAMAATLVVYAGPAIAAGAFLRPALPDASYHEQSQCARRCVDHQSVVHQRRKVCVRWCPEVRPECFSTSSLLSLGWTIRDARPVPYQPWLHPVDQLSTRRPFLAVPVDREWVAFRAVDPHHDGDGLVSSPSGDLIRDWLRQQRSDAEVPQIAGTG